MKHIFTLDKHIAQPGISVDEYLQSLCMGLASDIKNKKIIYLDTNFWLTLRDVELGRTKNSSAQAFYDVARELKEREVCIFPVSQDVFLEVMKQSDNSTRSATAQVIDHFSDGVSLICLEEGIILEVLNFYMKTTGMRVYPCKDLVWTKIAYTLGFVSPQTGLDSATNLSIQKAFIDQMWVASLSDMVKTIDFDDENALPSVDVEDALNEGKFKYARENSTFTSMFLSELAGFLEACEDQLRLIMPRLYELKTGTLVTEEELEKWDSASSVTTTIYNLHRLKKITTELPIFTIMPGLHAAARWDKERKFYNNDLHDFQHAAAALPYADYFFTEKNLAHLITQKMTGYDQLFDCKVTAKVSVAARHLLEIE